MNLFIKKLVAFFILTLIVYNGLEILLPYYHGNVEFSEKINFYHKNKKNFNTVLFGSSRTAAIKPTIVNYYLFEKDVKAFNFSTGGTSNPELYALVEHFVEELESNQVKNIILEISPIRDMSFKNLTTTRNTYYHNTSETLFSLKCISQEETLRNNRLKLYFKYGLHYTLNLVDFPKLRYLLNSPLPAQPFANTFDGFTPYTGSDSCSIPVINMKEMHQRKQASYLLSEINTHPSLSVHANRLNELYKLCEKKEIKLFFIVMPKLRSYNFARNVLSQLPAESILNFGNAEQYPEFYEYNYSIDLNHLSRDGIDLLTEKLCSTLKERI